MPRVVVKRDGRREEFIKEKIVTSAVKTGASVDLARKVADKIEKQPKDEIRTSEIRKSVLDELKLHNPDWPKRWLDYDKAVKRLYKHMY
jgi:transcriptional repressor NrdR